MRKLLFLAVLLSSPSFAAEWPSWRGVNSDGVSPDTGLPAAWSAEGENLLWSADVGGRSTPIVFGGQVCVVRLAEPDDPKRWQEEIVCLDEKSGKENWTYRRPIFQTDIPHHRVGWASLAADPETGRIYSLGVEGLAICFEKDGRIVWQRSFEEEVGRISGFGGRTITPIVDGDLVLFSFLSAGWGPNFIPRHRYYGVDKSTGQTRWISTPGGAPQDTTYSVPVVREIDGERIFVTGDGDGSVYGLQVATGKKLWGFSLSKRGLNVSPAVSADGVIFISHSEENVDGSTAMGRLVALDAKQVTEGEPKELWRVEGFQAGYASPALEDGILYHVDNSANLVAFDASNGEQLWRENLGIAQRGSPVIGDGKLYAADVDGKFQIFKLNGREAPERIDTDEFKNADGSATQINGSPAIADGRVFLLTNNTLYAIGTGEGQSVPEEPWVGPPTPAPSGAEPAQVQVVPAEVNLKPGGSQTFMVRTFDDKGRLIGEASSAEFTAQGVQGRISKDGELSIANENVPQGGKVVAKVGDLTGEALVAVRVQIPFETGFSEFDVQKVPAGWPAAQGRFQVVDMEGEKALQKPSGNPRSWRTTVYFGDPDARGYAIAADVMGKEARRRMPDIGLVSHRYTLALMGNAQRLMVRSWLSELERFSKEISFPWEPEVWYRMKMEVEVGESGPATVRGKVWKRGEAEPEAWTIEAEDPLPHRQGSPGIYGFSTADIFYDNLAVTEE